MSEFNYYVSVTYRNRGGDEHTRLLIGTADEVGREVGHMITHATMNGNGPVVAAPVHPSSVYKIGEST